MGRPFLDSHLQMTFIDRDQISQTFAALRPAEALADGIRFGRPPCSANIEFLNGREGKERSGNVPELCTCWLKVLNIVIADHSGHGTAISLTKSVREAADWIHSARVFGSRHRLE
jgi:hypothetical protein